MQQITMNQALSKLCPVGGEHLGDNNLTYGDCDNYVRVSLDTNGHGDQYELLRIKHIKAGKMVDQWFINISEGQHVPESHQHPGSKGGYYWKSQYSKFYCWEPVNVEIRVKDILKFTGVDIGQNPKIVAELNYYTTTIQRRRDEGYYNELYEKIS